MYKLSKRSRERLNGISTVLIDIIEEGIVNSPFDFGIPQYGGLRTAEDQNKLYQQGRDLPGSIITNVDGYIKKSYHQTGKAFDDYAHVDGRASWHADHLTSIARHLQALALDCYGVNLEWGGAWKNFKDYPHFQIK